MMKKRNDIAVAGFFGSFALILTYLITYLPDHTGNLTIAIVCGAVCGLICFLGMFIEGLKKARDLDRWEKEKNEPYLERFRVSWLADEKRMEGNLYLYKEKLIFYDPVKKLEISLKKETVETILTGAEDIEIFTQDRRILSVFAGKDSREAKMLTTWFSENKEEE